MKKTTIMIIPPNNKSSQNFSFYSWIIPFISLNLLFFSFLIGFLAYDYLSIRGKLENLEKLKYENQNLKDEALALLTNLKKVRDDLQDIQNYTDQISNIVNLKEKKNLIKKQALKKKASSSVIKSDEESHPHALVSPIPRGLETSQLELKPVFNELIATSEKARKQGFQLKQLLANLNKKRSILSSVPSIAPVNGWIASGYGYRISPFTGKKSMHRGIDIAAPIGTPIIAPANGVVIFAGKKAGFGNFIMLAHYGYGIITRYGHNAENLVKVGQNVKKGEQIATVGMTGRSTGPHLHYEVHINGKIVNPKKFIIPTSQTLSSN